jgi:hypothetical protein
LHKTKYCKKKGSEGFTLCCTVCKNAHTAWSNACPARKKEMQRVEKAKRAHSIYWHIPVKEKIAITKTQITRNIQNETTSQEPRQLAMAQMTIRRHLENDNVPSSGINWLDFGTNRRVPMEKETTAKKQLFAKTAISSPIAPSIGKEWATPTMQKMIPQHAKLAINPQFTALENSLAPMPNNTIN